MAKAHETAQQTAGEKAKAKPPQQAVSEQLFFLQDENLNFAGLGTAEPEERLARSLQRLPNDHLRRRHLTSAQQVAGNTRAAQAVQRLSAAPEGLVQRHPPGATLLGGIAEAPGGGGGGGEAATEPTAAGPTPTPAGAAPAETPAPEPAVSGPAAEEPAGAAAPGPEGGETTPAPGTEPEGGGAAPAEPAAEGGTGGPAPTELSMPTLQTAYAQEAIENNFGGVAVREIVTGTIHVVESMDALYREYDRIMIENGATNPLTGATWAYGDKAAVNAADGARTNAFAYDGEIWIDATQTDPTATVHEMLHVNTAPGFYDTAGRAINEGITQRLAVRAVQSTGHSVSGSEFTYVQEQLVVSALANLVGDGNIVNAYFNDPNILVSAYESVMGEDSFEALVNTLSPDSDAGYTAAIEMLGNGPSAVEKVTMVTDLLDGFITNGDIDQIELIISTCSEVEQIMIAEAMQGRISDISSEEKRNRLYDIQFRAMIGTVEF